MGDGIPELTTNVLPFVTSPKFPSSPDLEYERYAYQCPTNPGSGSVIIEQAES